MSEQPAEGLNSEDVNAEGLLVTPQVAEQHRDQLPGTPDEAGWRRLHPLSPVLQGGLFVVVITSILIANLRDRLINVFVADQQSSETGGQGIIEILVEERLVLAALGIVLGIALLVILFAWLSWRFHTYRVTDEAVEARKGLLFRKHRRAPLERIQIVNLQRPLLARMLGLTKIDVQTAGQDGKVELAYLSHNDAKIVRELILRTTHELRGETQSAHVQPLESDVHHSEVAPDASHPPPVESVVGSTASMFDQRAQNFIDDDIDLHATTAGALVRVPVGRLIGSILLSWEWIVFVGLLIAVPIAAALSSWAILASLVPIILIMLGIAFGQFNRGFNFALSRSREGVRTGSGLTSTNTETIPFGRIHAIDALQPLGWRPLGWWKIRVTTAGQSATQSGQRTMQNIVLPVGQEDDVLRVFATLLPGISEDDEEYEALRQGLVGHTDGFIGAGPKSAWVLLFGARRAGIQLRHQDREDASIRIRRGAVTRHFVVMPILRAQSVQLHRPPIHHLLKLATVQAHTVLGPVNVTMRGLELESAQEMFDVLAQTVVKIQGREAVERENQGELYE